MSTNGFSSILQGLAQEAISHLTKVMKTGLPSLHIPVLDPLSCIPEVKNYKFNNSNIDVIVSFGGMTLTGLSNLSLGSTMQISNKVVTLPLTLAVVSLAGNYSITGTAYSVVPVKGSGPFNLSAQTVAMSPQFQVNWPPNEPPQVEIAHPNPSATKLQVQFDDLDGSLSDLINSALNAHAQTLANGLAPTIGGVLAPAVESLINTLLRENNH